MKELILQASIKGGLTPAPGNMLSPTIMQLCPWSYISFKNSANYQIVILNEILLHFILQGSEKVIDDPQIAPIILIQMLYVIENAVSNDPNLIMTDLFLETFAKLLLLLDTTDLLYIAVPAISLFDERAIITQERENACLAQLDDGRGSFSIVREGGYLRIILKLAFLFWKFDPSENGAGGQILGFIIFRDKQHKEMIKQYGKLRDITEKGESKEDKTAKKIEKAKKKNK